MHSHVLSRSASPVRAALALALCFVATACSDEDSSPETGQGAAAPSCALGDRSVVDALIDNAQLTAVAPTPADDFASGFSILEGPSWRDGALYLSQINANVASPPPARLLRYDIGASAFV